MKRTLKLSLFLFFIAFSASTGGTNSQDSTVLEQVSDEKSSETSTLLTNFQKTKLSLEEKHAEQKALREAMFAQTAADIIAAEEQGNPLFFPLKITRILERSARETLEQQKKFKGNPQASNYYTAETNPWAQLESALKVMAESLKQRMIKKKQNPIITPDQDALITESTEAITGATITETTNSAEDSQQELPPAQVSRLTKIKNGIMFTLMVLVSKKERAQFFASLRKPNTKQTQQRIQTTEQEQTQPRREPQPSFPSTQAPRKPRMSIFTRLASLFRSNKKDEFGTFSFDGLTTDRAFENDELCDLDEPFNHEEYFKERTYLKEYVPLPPKQDLEDIFKPIYARTGVDSTYWSRKLSWFMGLAEEDCNLSTIVSHSALPLAFDIALAVSKTFYTLKYNTHRNSLVTQAIETLNRKFNRTIQPFANLDPETVAGIDLGAEFTIKISLMFIQYLLSHCVMDRSLHGLKNALWDDPFFFWMTTAAVLTPISFIIIEVLEKELLANPSNARAIFAKGCNFLKKIVPPLILMTSLMAPIMGKQKLLMQVEKELADNVNAIGLKRDLEVPRDMRGHKYMIISQGNIAEALFSGATYIGASMGNRMAESKISDKNVLAGMRAMNLIGNNFFNACLNLFFGMSKREKVYIRYSDLEYLTPTTKNRILTFARSQKIFSSQYYGFILGENIKDLIAVSKQIPTITKEGHRMFKNWRQGIKPIDLSEIKQLSGHNDTSPVLESNLIKLLEQAENYSRDLPQVYPRERENLLIAWFLMIKSNIEELSPAERGTLPESFTNDHIEYLDNAAHAIIQDASSRSAVEENILQVIR